MSTPPEDASIVWQKLRKARGVDWQARQAYGDLLEVFLQHYDPAERVAVMRGEYVSPRQPFKPLSSIYKERTITNTLSEEARAMWPKLEAANETKNRAREACNELREVFLHSTDRADRIAVMWAEAVKPESHYDFMTFTEEMPQDEQLELLCSLLYLVGEGGTTHYIEPYNVIMSLPHDMVAARIRPCIEHVKQASDGDAMYRVLDFLSDFDRELALEVSHDLASHQDESFRQASEEFMRDSAAE